MARSEQLVVHALPHTCGFEHVFGAALLLCLAREQGVPPYVIFHDSTLLEILNQRPGNLTDLGKISGVGLAKLARYGDDFLKVIEDEENGVK